MYSKIIDMLHFFDFVTIWGGGGMQSKVYVEQIKELDQKGLLIIRLAAENDCWVGEQITSPLVTSVFDECL